MAVVCSKCGGVCKKNSLGKWFCWNDCEPAGPQPEAPQVKRVRTSDATNDIENAFKAWEASILHVASCSSVSAAQAIIFAGDCGDARARVLTWLAQVSADQRQLHAALLACQAMVAAETDIDRWEAVRLANLALETK